MNRFRNERRHFRIFRKLHLSILAFIVLLLAFLHGLNDISASTRARQTESLETAIQRNITHCYAVEGTYPPSLEYLKQHYGLTYNEKEYFVDYQAIGSNMMPDVTIIVR